MTWSKVGSTTRAWYGGDTSVTSYGVNNAWNADGDAVIQEWIAFLETRGWVSNYFLTNSGSAGGDHNWRLYKDVLCENGVTERHGFALQYSHRTSAADTFRCDLWDQANDAIGRTLFSGAPNVIYGGKWNFWTSDGDTDSYLILTGPSTNQMVSFWPPAGSMFQQGFYNTNYPRTAGIGVMYYGSGLIYSGLANTSTGEMVFPHVGSLQTGLTNIPEYFNFTWVDDYYGRPIFHTEGGDLGILCRMKRGSGMGVSNTTYKSIEVVQVEDDYHISVGDQNQRLLFNAGTNPPVF